MSSSNPEAFLAVFLFQDIIGLSSSIFTIICLSAPDTISNRISTLNRILMALSASNICYIIIMSLNMFIEFVWPQLYQITYVFYTISYLAMYSITSNCWLTCTLCLFYFLKIVPSQPGILTKLKNLTNTITWRLLLVAEVVSLGGSFLSILTSNQNYLKNNSTESQVEKSEESKEAGISFSGIAMAVICLPFLVTIVTTVISASLLKHYNDQMKKNMGSTNTNVKDYRTAVKTMSGFLILYVLIFLIMIIISLNMMDGTMWWYWVCVTLLLSYPTVQSVLLIYGNQRLKEALSKIFTIKTKTQPSRDFSR